MKIEEFCTRLNEHVFSKIVPQVSNPVTKFSLAAAIGTGVIGRKAIDAADMLGCVEDGEVDIVRVRNAMDKGFEAVGELPIYGLRFTKPDADMFLASLS